MVTSNKMKSGIFLLMLMSLFLLPLNSRGMQPEHSASVAKIDCDINGQRWTPMTGQLDG